MFLSHILDELHLVQHQVPPSPPHKVRLIFQQKLVWCHTHVETVGLTPPLQKVRTENRKKRCPLNNQEYKWPTNSFKTIFGNYLMQKKKLWQQGWIYSKSGMWKYMVRTNLLCLRCLRLPRYRSIFSPGHQRLNSISQFSSLQVLTTTKWGPQIPATTTWHQYVLHFILKFTKKNSDTLRKHFYCL